MSIANQLFQLQEIDSGIESAEHAVTKITRELADDKLVREVQAWLDAARQRNAELNKAQRAIENEIADITAKLKSVEKDLYSGKGRSPKELTDLQREAEGLKVKRATLEEKELGILEESEDSNKKTSEATDKLKKVQLAQEELHKSLSVELERERATISGLADKKRLAASSLDSQTLTTYEGVRKKHSNAVVKIAQGLCTGCRISLPVSELQKAKTGALTRCSSCGRILFLA